MKAAAKPAQVPKLRFPGFEGEWEQVALGEAAKVIDCKHRTPQYVETGVPIISPGTIKWGPLDVVSPTKRVTEEEYVSLMDHCDPQLDDLVLSRNQSMGVASRIMTSEEFVLGQDTVLIQQINGNGGIIFFRLQTEGTQGVIGKLSGGSTFSRINLKDIRQIPLVLPTERDEQQKIAAFLTAVDGRIEQLSRKKALLEATKKGVMQQLFTQTLRFQDDHGHDFPDWEEKTLGDMCSCFSGGTPTSGKRDYYGGSIPFIRSAEIGSDKTALFLTNKGLEESAAKMVNEGDLLIALYGANSGEVGISRMRGAINQAILCVRSKQRVGYLYYWFEYSKTSIVNTYLQGGQGNLSGKIVQSLLVPLPSLPEQTKIAGFLSAMDGKIAAVGEQMRQTQAWKKGLLQQMFV
jgi:type I restriction enzyme S subunit